MLHRALITLALLESILCLTLGPSSTRGDEPGAAATKETTAALTAWVDNRVMVAAVLDVEHVDIDKALPDPAAVATMFGAIPDVSKEAIAALGKGMAEARTKAIQWRTDFVAAGGQKAFLIVRMANKRPVPSVIIPLSEKADAVRMKTLLAGLEVPESMMFDRDGVIIIGEDKLKGLPLKEPCERLAGFEAAAAALAPDNPIFAAYFIPTADQLALVQMGIKEGLSELRKAFPPGTLDLLPPRIEQKFEWAASRVSAPSLAMRLVLKATDDATATELADLGNKLLSTIPFDQAPEGPFKNAIKALKFTSAKDLVDFRLDGPTLSAGTLGIMLPALGKARQAARQAKALANGRSILVAVHAYAADYKDQFPESLDALAKYIDAPLPANPSGSTWVYIKPAKKLGDIQKPAETVLIHESFAEWPRLGAAVGFADGHLTVIKDKAEFENLVSK